MVFQFSELPLNFSGVTYGVAGIAAAIIVVARLSRGPNLDAIPTVGPSSWFGSWWAGSKNSRNVADVVQEGYEKHKSAPFKIAGRYNWMVVLSNREHVQELFRAPDDMLSLKEGMDEQLNFGYVLGYEIVDNSYHVAVIRSQLARNIAMLYPEIKDEIVTAFDEVLDLRGHEWKSIPALNAIQQVVCRTSNRLFVGLPLCRDPDWIDLNIQYTIDAVKAGAAIGLFPKFMRPVAGYFLTDTVRRGRMRGLKHVGPIIEERLKCLSEYGNEWDGKPNDFLSWLIEEAEGSQLRVELLVARVLFVNFASIHSSSNSFTNAFFYLAANPQYIQPLREEVESIVEKEGWSKDSLSKMHKIDSFLRECLRLKGIGPPNNLRKAIMDFTLSDGTIIPKGALVGVAAQSLHCDEEFYKNANTFDPFRFADMHETDREGVKCQFTSTAIEYLLFGFGRHACPGRFFAANELKSMLAHIVVTYDIKLEEGLTPSHILSTTTLAVNPDARILFRKRVGLTSLV